MRIHRNDVRIDKRQVTVKNSSFLGYSKGTLKCGDFFTYLDENQIRIGKMHGRIAMDAQNVSLGHIVAQVLSNNGQFTMQRWVDPSTVLETIPEDKVNLHMSSFFADDEINIL